MKVILTAGDIFATPQVRAIAHGTNCLGMMGKGIALQISQRFPEMAYAYRQLGHQRGIHLGDCTLFRPQPQFRGETHYVFNLATQPRPGPCASLDALRSAGRRMLELAVQEGVRQIVLPVIGSGLGGLANKDCLQVLTHDLMWDDHLAVSFEDCLDLIIVDTYVPNQPLPTELFGP